MGWLTVILSALVSAAVSGLVGLLIRVALERKVEEARVEAKLRRERRVRYTELRNAWMHAAGRVIYHLVRKAEGRQVNGDLEDSYRRLEQVESDIKCMDRSYAAEAQEE